jgi:predicted nuclease of restriction endonuclease-like (RecB) superfamily
MPQKSLQNYAVILEDIKKQIRESRLKAALAVNCELIKLYWKIGAAILEKQKISKWGDKILENLSRDLSEEFPDMKGFGTQNLKYMKRFASEYDESEFGQQAVDQLPWGHNVALIYSVKNKIERQFYIRETIANGWSRNVLEIQIKTKLFHRQGKTINNFKRTLPAEQSDLINQTLKDPYIFDFLTIGKEASELEIEKELSHQITKFLLELGKGFSFVGRQFHLKIGGDDFYIDLLFYHIRLKCYVVVELKAEKFKPEDAGKLNFYLAAIDGKVKGDDDNPTIGILLCRGKNGLVAEYSLRGINKPIGVTNYEITEKLPKKFQTQLPTIAEIEKGFGEKFKRKK